MKRILVLIMAVLSLAIAGTPTVLAAQTVNVASIAKTVEAKNTKSLLKALEKPLSKSELPKGFTEAILAGGAGATPAAGATPSGGGSASPMATPASSAGCKGGGAGVIGSGTVKGTEGTVSYCVTGDSAVLGGLASVNTLNYIVLNPKDVTPNLLDEIQSGAQGSASKGMTIKKTTLAGTPALLLDYSENSSGTFATVNMYIVPVGNVVVIGLVTIADTQAISASAVRKPAQDLTTAGIQHLGTIAKTVK